MITLQVVECHGLPALYNLLLTKEVQFWLLLLAPLNDLYICTILSEIFELSPKIFIGSEILDSLLTNIKVYFFFQLFLSAWVFIML